MSEALSTFLAGKRLLLVLDNYEHLLEAAPVVSDLLQAGPSSVVLVTSREPLRLRGEQEFAVPPLPVPDAHRHAAGTGWPRTRRWPSSCSTPKPPEPISS